MSYADEAALKAHILRVTRRTGDAAFDLEWPRLLAEAEQRMKYGSDAPVPTPAIRVRGMETRATLTFTSGVADLPADYLQAKSLTWAGAIPVQPIYRTPEDFAGAVVTAGDGFPVMYTVEGDDIRIKPAASGTATLVYYRTLAAATVGQNWIMANAPGIYKNAVLYEAYRFLRNPDEADRAIAEYASLVGGLMRSDGAMKNAASLYPRVRNSRVHR